MFIPLITEIMQLFASIFMKFFRFPVGDLGFNLGTLMIFLILLKFAFRVILPELMLPTLGLGYGVKLVGKAAVRVAKGAGKDLANAYKNGEPGTPPVQYYDSPKGTVRSVYVHQNVKSIPMNSQKLGYFKQKQIGTSKPNWVYGKGD